MKRINNSIPPRRAIAKARAKKLKKLEAEKLEKLKNKAAFLPEVKSGKRFQGPPVRAHMYKRTVPSSSLENLKKEFITLTPIAPIISEPAKMRIVPPTTITVPMPTPTAPPSPLKPVPEPQK